LPECIECSRYYSRNCEGGKRILRNYEKKMNLII
jgi:hypothetical protein